MLTQNGNVVTTCTSLNLRNFELKRQCIDLSKQGLVRVSNSPYAAPIAMVRKADGSIRVFVDYIALNECIVEDSFPLPRTDDLLDKLRNAKCMAHLNFHFANNQVRMSDDGTKHKSIVATATFRDLTPNRDSCLMEMLITGLVRATLLPYFPDL